jgi:hypothetical protein
MLQFIEFLPAPTSASSSHRPAKALRTDKRQFIAPTSVSSSHQQASVHRTDKRQFIAPISTPPHRLWR